MEWQKFHSSFYGHPKVIDLPLAAKGLWAECFAYVGHQESLGFVPRGIVRRIAGEEEGRVLSDLLVAAGLWDVVDGGWRMHEYEVYQPTSAESVEQRRALGRERTRQWRERRQGSPTTGPKAGDSHGDGHGDVTVTHREKNKSTESPSVATLPTDSRATGSPTATPRRVGGHEVTVVTPAVDAAPVVAGLARFDGADGQVLVGHWVDEFRRTHPGLTPSTRDRGAVGREVVRALGEGHTGPTVAAALTVIAERGDATNRLLYLCRDIHAGRLPGQPRTAPQGAQSRRIAERDAAIAAMYRNATP